MTRDEELERDNTSIPSLLLDNANEEASESIAAQVGAMLADRDMPAEMRADLEQRLGELVQRYPVPTRRGLERLGTGRRLRVTVIAP